MGGALLLILPVAWAFVATRLRKEVDSSVVSTIVVLPIAVDRSLPRGQTMLQVLAGHDTPPPPVAADWFGRWRRTSQGPRACRPSCTPRRSRPWGSDPSSQWRPGRSSWPMPTIR